MADDALSSIASTSDKTSYVTKRLPSCLPVLGPTWSQPSGVLQHEWHDISGCPDHAEAPRRSSALDSSLSRCIMRLRCLSTRACTPCHATSRKPHGYHDPRQHLTRSLTLRV